MKRHGKHLNNGELSAMLNVGLKMNQGDSEEGFTAERGFLALVIVAVSMIGQRVYVRLSQGR
jgi:hypothetical protein